MPKRLMIAVVVLSAAVCFTRCRGPVTAADAGNGAAQTKSDPTRKKIALSLHAGRHARRDVFVSVLIDAGKSQSVFVEYADGTLGRAQLTDPGLANAAWRGAGKKELHFVAPKMAQGETANVVAALSESPVEGRTYVWSGESRQNRRLSCGQCHQGLSLPTGEELRRERKMLEETGKPPSLKLPRILPTSTGRDFRWHEKLGKYLTSTCWECHARHMVQYEFGQSLPRDLPWAPDPPHRTGAAKPPAVRSVFYTVFRVRGDRAVSHPLSSGDGSPEGTSNWEIHYGFDRATVEGRPCSEVLQEHVGTLSEEAGKFIGRHVVQIDWVGNTQQKRKVVAREERQLTVKDYRGRNKSYAMWIDFASTLSPAAGALRMDGAGSPAGFRFVPSLDAGAEAEYRESAAWRAITFVSEGTTYTAVCFNHPDNPKPTEAPIALPRDRGPTVAARGIGYNFSAECDERHPLLVHYRLWIQGGRMPAEEIQSLSDDFLDPVQIEVKQPDRRPASPE
jgi:hypothetical protein